MPDNLVPTLWPGATCIFGEFQRFSFSVSLAARVEACDLNSAQQQKMNARPVSGERMGRGSGCTELIS